MSKSATLSSRLRILVAKAFRAEKLYTPSKSSNRRDAMTESMATHTIVSDAAQELRAKEWQKSYYELRVSLNNILSLGNTKEQAKQLLLLKARYQARCDEHATAVKKLVVTVQETAQRQEFAHVLKLALELIRLKAVSQSSKVICEELHAVLSRSGRSTEVDHELLQNVQETETEEAEEFLMPENVVSLAERRAVRGR